MAYEESNVLNGEDAAVVEIDGKLVSILSGEERDIPLNRLHLSPNNVRKKHDPSTIPELAAAIMAEGGLLNPLAVIPEKIKGSAHGISTPNSTSRDDMPMPRAASFASGSTSSTPE